MSYAIPNRITYSRAIGTTSTVWAVKPPEGCSKLRIADMNVSVTADYNAGVSEALVSLGVATNTDVAGYLALGTALADSTLSWVTQQRRNGNPV